MVLCGGYHLLRILDRIAFSCIFHCAPDFLWFGTEISSKNIIRLREDPELILLCIKTVFDERSLSTADFIPQLRGANRKDVCTQDCSERMRRYRSRGVPEDDCKL